MKDIEQKLITKVLDTKDISKVLDSKLSDSFFTYQDVWEYLKDYYIKYRVVPPEDALKRKFPDFNALHTDETIEFLIDELNDEFLRLKLGELLTNASVQLEENPREVLTYIFGKVSALGHQTDVVKDTDLVNDYWRRVSSLRKRAESISQGNEILGIPSLISPIDLLFGGWQSGDLITVMGWTASGKSWSAANFAANAWKMGKTPLYFSLEMDDDSLAYRIDTLLGTGEFSNTSLINGKNISVEKYESWAKNTYFEKHPFYIVTNEGMEDVNQLTVQMKVEQYRPDLVILDYHGLFDDARKGRNETERHRNLSKDFKRLAVRFGVPVIDIVAVTMEDGHDQRAANLNEVAWSKQLAYDSDLVLSIFKNSNTMTVEAKKSRRSELFAFKLLCDFDTGKMQLLDW